MVMDFVKELSKSSMRGLIANSAPLITKGMINELITLQEITPETIITMVEKKETLWKRVKPEHYPKIQAALAQVDDDFEWFNAEWLLEAIVEKHPAIVSLFVPWKKGQNWLKRQVEEIKTEIEKLKKDAGRAVASSGASN